MTTITETITALVNVPTTADPDNFDAYADNLLGTQIPNLITEINTWAGQTNTVAGEVNTNRVDAETAQTASEAARDLSQTYASQSAASAQEAEDSALALADFRGEWSLLTGALNMPASVAHEGGLWILLANLADVTASEPGQTADWSLVNGTVRETITGAKLMRAWDRGKIIDAQSGTFPVTFESAPTLGSRWYAYVKNSGTGDVTLDPDGSEQIDGLTSYVMYPQELRMIICTGTAFVTYVLNSFSRTFDSSGTFTKPPGYKAFAGIAWSAGSSGGKDTATARGGAGGGAFPFDIPAATFGASETITIGAGGAAVTASSTIGNAGGNTSIGSLLTVYGAAGGASPSGGAIGVGSALVSSDTGSFAGATAATSGRSSLYGGAAPSNDASANSGSSIYGGGAGGGVDASTNLRTAGTSQFGGAGGAASISGNGTAGTQPGGGGGATATGTQSGAGGDGRVIIRGVL